MLVGIHPSLFCVHADCIRSLRIRLGGWSRNSICEVLLHAGTFAQASCIPEPTNWRVRKLPDSAFHRIGVHALRVCVHARACLSVLNYWKIILCVWFRRGQGVILQQETRPSGRVRRLARSSVSLSDVNMSLQDWIALRHFLIVHVMPTEFSVIAPVIGGQVLSAIGVTAFFVFLALRLSRLRDMVLGTCLGGVESIWNS